MIFGYGCTTNGADVGAGNRDTDLDAVEEHTLRVVDSVIFMVVAKFTLVGIS